MRFIVACAGIAAPLTAFGWRMLPAQGQPANDPRVNVHFDAQREGVRLYEIDPNRPIRHRITPLCDSPCERFVTPLGRTYFYEGEGTARSAVFKIPPYSPDVTIHAEARSDTLHSVGTGAVVVGVLGMVTSLVLTILGATSAESTEGSRYLWGGLAGIPLSGLSIGVGFSLLHEGKSSARVEPGRPPAVSLRLGPKGPALVF
jgi:hypothetical protein